MLHRRRIESTDTAASGKETSDRQLLMTGGVICINCPAGRYASSTASVSCSYCQAGKYQSQTGKSSCNTCQSGKYQSQTGQSSCLYCPSGQSPNSARTACESTSCPAGKYHGAMGPGGYMLRMRSRRLSNCVDCATGQYTSVSGSMYCNYCGSGELVIVSVLR